jgi:hypothetical protein
VDGDGRPDVVTGKWWYRAPDWERFEIPGATQVHAAADLDGDGRVELVGTTGGDADGPADGGPALSADLVLLDPVDPTAGEWERHRVGAVSGDWIQGSALAPLGADGAQALVASCGGPDAESHAPELFEVPTDPTDEWRRRTLADVPSGQDLVVADLTGGESLDVFVGPHLVESHGAGEFEAQRVLPDGFEPASLAVADLTGDGRLNVVAGEAVAPETTGDESGDAVREAFAGDAFPDSNRQGFDPDDNRLRGPGDSLEEPPLGRLAWFQLPENPREEWSPSVIDRIRHPRSVGAGDLDGDGVPEVVAGEHDPSWRYRSQSRLFAYGRAGDDGRAWRRTPLDDRFEHNAGARVVTLDDRPAVLSHGWSDSRYVHLVEFGDD